jgi:hypothetical protein
MPSKQFDSEAAARAEAAKYPGSRVFEVARGVWIASWTTTESKNNYRVINYNGVVIAEDFKDFNDVGKWYAEMQAGSSAQYIVQKYNPSTGTWGRVNETENTSLKQWLTEAKLSGSGGGGAGGPTRTEQQKGLVDLYRDLGWNKATAQRLAKAHLKWKDKGYDDEQIFEHNKLKDVEGYEENLKGLRQLEKTTGVKQNVLQYLRAKSDMKVLIRVYSDMLPQDFRNAQGALSEKKLNAAVDKLIGAGISGKEFEERILTVQNLINKLDPAVLKSFQQNFGMNKSDLAAWALTSKDKQEEFLRKYQTGMLGVEAINQGLAIDTASLTNLVDKEVDPRYARYAFGEVRKEMDTYNMLSGIEGYKSFTASQLTLSELGLSGDLAERTRMFRQKETSRWGGTSGGTNVINTTQSGMV